MNFSPGASGFGSETISSTETTPGSELKMKSSVGLELPERAQAQRVGGEHALVAVAGDQRHRALGERAHRLAQVHVEASAAPSGSARISSTIGGTTISIASARTEAVAADQRLDRAVEVLGVRVAGWIGTPSIRASWRSCSIVLISPLWPSTPNGCTRLNEGQVLVE